MLACAACVLTGCATIMSGSTARIRIDGDVTEPVRIVTSYQTYEDRQLPTFVDVKRRQLDGQHITLSSEHCNIDDIVLEKKINGNTLFNLGFLYFGIPGLVVDIASNSVNTPKQKQFYVTGQRKEGVTDEELASALMSDEERRQRDEQIAAKLRKKEERQEDWRKQRHSVGFGLGFGFNTTQRRYSNMERTLNSLYGLEHLVYDGCGFDFNDDMWVFSIDYQYQVSKHWAMGVLTGWGDTRYQGLANGEPFELTPDTQSSQETTTNSWGYVGGNIRSHTFFVLPSVKYTWKRFPDYNWQIYSRISLGAVRQYVAFYPFEYIHHIKPMVNKTWDFAYQLSPIGIEGGFQHVGAFLEFGYGCHGFFSFGLRTYF